MGRILILAFLLCTVILSAIGVHRFSIPAWHDYLDHSRATEILAGSPRAIRSDDWLVTFPQILSQVRQDPSFPVRNSWIGVEGQDMRVMVPPVPIRHWITFFRPQLWGYFLGANVGVAWNWWFFELGVFFAALGLFLTVSSAGWTIAASGAITLVFSPFLQFWALNSGSIFVAGCLALISLKRLLQTTSRGSALAHGGFLAWCGMVLLFGMLYPAFAVPVIYSVLFTAIGIIAPALLSRAVTLRQTLTVILAVLLVAAGAAAFYWQSREAIHLVTGTTYPGLRVSTGGEVLLGKLLNSYYLPWIWSHGNWETLTNICESGSFFFTFPLVIGLIVYRGWRKHIRPTGLEVAISAFLLIALFYQLVGIPSSLSKLTGWSRVPGWRALTGMGLADTLLLVLYLSRRDQLSRAEQIVIGIAQFCILAFAGWQLKKLLPQLPLPILVVAPIGWAVLSAILLSGWRYAIAAWAVFSVALTCGFNPLVFRGADYLWNNPISREIQKISAQGDKTARWAAFGAGPTANILRVVGVPSIDGVQMYPQFALWSALDPSAQQTELYNRYLHVSFEAGEKGGAPHFSLTAPDALTVRINPEHPVLRDLKVNFVLTPAAASAPFKTSNEFEQVSAISGFEIYARRSHFSASN